MYSLLFPNYHLLYHMLKSDPFNSWCIPYFPNYLDHFTLNRCPTTTACDWWQLPAGLSPWPSCTWTRVWDISTSFHLLHQKGVSMSRDICSVTGISRDVLLCCWDIKRYCGLLLRYQEILWSAAGISRDIVVCCWDIKRYCGLLLRYQDILWSVAGISRDIVVCCWDIKRYCGTLLEYQEILWFVAGIPRDIVVCCLDIKRYCVALCVHVLVSWISYMPPIQSRSLVL